MAPRTLKEFEENVQHTDGQTALLRGTGNHLFDRLPDDEWRQIAELLEEVDLPLGMKLTEPDAPVDFVYFPSSGCISTVATTSAGESVEVFLAGREGFSGVAALFDLPEMAHGVVVQVAGRGYRMRAAAFRNFVQSCPGFRSLVYRVLYMRMVLAAQSVLCNRLHEVEQRLARWLLTLSDRAESDQVLVTQEYMAEMLGARRSTVTVAAGALQDRGLITYSRGKITILDRPRTIDAACECYSIVASAYRRTWGQETS
ncbi:MAG TPA: Crp/Fnr family transcriptional regulator [Acidobacteriaceae bacterium]|nr:Crp/Fnr family transcriptional regulator [Acidobacteriaceae bacterium]